MVAEKVLGVDTGTKPGFAILTREAPHLEVCVERILSYDFTRMVELHGTAGRWVGLRSLLDELGDDFTRVGWEDVHWHTGVDAAHMFGGWVAVIEMWAWEKKIPTHRIGVGTGKRALSGRGDAKADAMRVALSKRFGIIDNTKAADLSHAVGVALATLEA